MRVQQGGTAASEIVRKELFKNLLVGLFSPTPAVLLVANSSSAGIAIAEAFGFAVPAGGAGTYFLSVESFGGTSASYAIMAAVRPLVIQSADLAVTTTDSPDPAVAGGDITYTITLSNAGPDDAQNVTLTDVIPANTTFVSAAQNGS